MRKLILILTTILISFLGQSQIWKHPYFTMGIQPLKTEFYKKPLKCIVVDTSEYGSQSVYYEYDLSGNMIKEAYGTDTTYIFYDDFDYPIIRVNSISDTVYNNYTRDENNNLIKSQMIRGIDTNITEYTYEQGNLIKTKYNSVLYDEMFYDSLGRIIEVRNYHHKNDGLSEIIYYQHISKNEIIYEECPYNIEGNRYNWPCEKSYGILNKYGDLKRLESTFYNGTDTAHVSISKYYYDRHHRVKKINMVEHDKEYETKYYYNKLGVMILIENYQGKELYRQTKINLLE